MADVRSKLDLLYQEVLGEVTEIVARVEDLKNGIPDATAALSQAASAAGAVREAVARIPDTILQQTAHAGTDLKGEIVAAGKAITQDIAAQGKATINAASQASVAVLGKAIAKLGASAAARREEMTREMQVAAAKAIRDQIQLGLAAKLARSWGLVSGFLLVAYLLGVGTGIGAPYLDGKVLPWGWHTVRAGAGECGQVQIVVTGASGPVLRTIEVCGATKD